jgi:hypothetical protein
LIADVLVDQDASDQVLDYLSDLLPDDPQNSLLPDDPRCWSVWLAAQIIDEPRPHEVRM